MKKLFSLALVLAMLLSAAAFAESVDYAGMWYLTAMETSEETYTPATFGIEMALELKEDGAAIGTSSMLGGEEAETQEGTWVIEGDGVTVTLDDMPMSMVPEDGALVAEQDDMKMIFTREKPDVEVFQPAAPKADATVEDFAGNWTAFKMGSEGIYLDVEVVGAELTAAIEGTTITINGIIFTDEAVETEFVDGALTFTAEDPENAMLAGVEAKLLEDDTLSLTLTISESMEFILQRAE